MHLQSETNAFKGTCALCDEHDALWRHGSYIYMLHGIPYALSLKPVLTDGKALVAQRFDVDAAADGLQQRPKALDSHADRMSAGCLGTYRGSKGQECRAGLLCQRQRQCADCKDGTPDAHGQACITTACCMWACLHARKEATCAQEQSISLLNTRKPVTCAQIKHKLNMTMLCPCCVSGSSTGASCSQVCCLVPTKDLERYRHRASTPQGPVVDALLIKQQICCARHCKYSACFQLH